MAVEATLAAAGGRGTSGPGRAPRAAVYWNQVRAMARGSADHPASVEVYWLPLGAGDTSHCVRTNGRLFEAVAARAAHRERLDLYHSALRVRLGSDRYVIEMAPVWGLAGSDHGGVAEGPVGMRRLGRSRLFRYEVRRWRDGVIPDIAEAMESPQGCATDPRRTTRLLRLVPDFPTATWGRDEQATGDMWNSNSLTSWLLVRSGHDVGQVRPPAGGRAPGWQAGLVVAARQDAAHAAPRARAETIS
jgi:hypothetical protein